MLLYRSKHFRKQPIHKAAKDLQLGEVLGAGLDTARKLDYNLASPAIHRDDLR